MADEHDGYTVVHAGRDLVVSRCTCGWCSSSSMSPTMVGWEWDGHLQECAEAEAKASLLALVTRQTAWERSWLLEPVVTSAAVARGFIGEFGAGRGLDPELLATVVLLTSELVTNAVVHAETMFVLGARAQSSFRVSVDDTSTSNAQVAVAEGDADSGRGLSMVATLSQRWGIDRTAFGKSVWFEVARESHGGDAARDLDLRDGAIDVVTADALGPSSVIDER